jgi:hypothetical protein
MVLGTYLALQYILMLYKQYFIISTVSWALWVIFMCGCARGPKNVVLRQMCHNYTQRVPEGLLSVNRA